MEGELEPFVRHGTDEERIEISADEILNAIAQKRDIDVKYAVIVGNLDVRGIQEQLKLPPKSEGTMDQFAAALALPVMASDLVIGCSEIRGNVFFDQLEFNGNVLFHDVTFGEYVRIARSVFSRKIRFTHCSFSQEVSFYDTSFREDAGFMATVFNASISFEHSTFSKRAFFSGAQFSAASFTYCIFVGMAYLNDVTFSNSVDFGYASFRGDVIFRSTVFGGRAYFMEATFSGFADFRRVVFNDGTDFSSATFGTAISFANANMGRPASFSEVRYKENMSHIGLWNEFLRPILQRIVLLITKRKLRIPYGPVQQLPTGDMGRVRLDPWPSRIETTDFFELNTNTVMDGSTNPYLKRYIDDEQWIKSWRERGGGSRKALFVFWEVMSHCGRSFFLWASWSLSIALIFGFLYAQYPFPSWLSWIPGFEWLLTNVPHPVLHIDSKLGATGELIRETTGFTPYYFSIVTFTTLGFGDVTPLGLAGEVWLAIEVVLGYVMLGGLISIFANKFARRS